MALHEHRRVTHAAVVEVVGGLDLSTLTRWEAEVGNASEASRTVVLDLTAVDFLDSAGVHGLFRMLAALEGQGKDVAVVAPSGGPVRRLLEILDLPAIARLCETREDAAALSRPFRSP